MSEPIRCDCCGMLRIYAKPCHYCELFTTHKCDPVAFDRTETAA